MNAGTCECGWPIPCIAMIATSAPIARSIETYIAALRLCCPQCGAEHTNVGPFVAARSFDDAEAKRDALGEGGSS